MPIVIALYENGRSSVVATSHVIDLFLGISDAAKVVAGIWTRKEPQILSIFDPIVAGFYFHAYAFFEQQIERKKLR